MDKIHTDKITGMTAFDGARGSDEGMPITGLQVHTEGIWIPATREVWRSWTGPRAVWGIPYHGPVYSLHSQDDTTPWDGPRVCGCKTCQADVAPDVRPN